MSQGNEKSVSMHMGGLVRGKKKRKLYVFFMRSFFSLKDSCLVVLDFNSCLFPLAKNCTFGFREPQWNVSKPSYVIINIQFFFISAWVPFAVLPWQQ